MKTPLGTEVDLDPGQVVLNGVPPSQHSAKGAQQLPLFSVHVYLIFVATVAHLSYC